MRILKMEHFSPLKEQKQAETAEFMSLYLKDKKEESKRTVTSSGQTQSSILKFWVFQAKIKLYFNNYARVAGCIFPAFELNEHQNKC